MNINDINVLDMQKEFIMINTKRPKSDNQGH